VSATHGLNVGELLEHVCGLLSEGRRPSSSSHASSDDDDDLEEFLVPDDDASSDFHTPLHADHLPAELREDELLAPAPPGPLRVAFVGRPNVGKSSLINYLIKEKRLIVDDVPGTTRGPVEVPFELDGRDVVLVDTAGIKKRDRKDDDITRICSAVARGAIKQADICVHLIDGSAGIVSQDKHVAGDVAEMNRACILAVNKWDLVDEKAEARKEWDSRIQRQFRFLPHATTVYLSAKTGRGAKGLLGRIAHVADCCTTLIPTGRLNEMLREAQLVHPAPTRRSGRRLKIFYAVQLRNRPGTFAFVVNDPELVHFSFERFIENALRRAADFTGVPIRFIYRQRTQKKGRGKPVARPRPAPVDEGRVPPKQRTRTTESRRGRKRPR